MKFQTAIGYFYYTPQKLKSQHMVIYSFCCRPPGVFGGIAGRQQLVNTKSADNLDAKVHKAKWIIIT